MLMVGIAILVFAVYLSSQPELAADLENLVQRLPIVMNSPARLSNLLEPYLSNPVLIISLVGFIAVIVPVIEETLKPIGVWLLAGRNLSPTEGFIAGAISGAGYALFESLFLPFSGDGWAVLMFGRLGTSAIHILTTALTGWGLAYAWRDGNYLRLGLQFLAAITLHAAWNAITVLNTAAILIPASMLTSLATRWLPYALALMAVACIILLYVFNRRLAAAAAIQAAQASTELTPVS
jgi:RsiW-degrading membrane proteinase PrsW (M82 family)